MLAQAVKPLVRLVDRYLPDPYIFVLILTLIVIIAAMAVERVGPIAVIGMWGDGFWGLLAFSMQMLLVLVTGFMLASTPPVKRVLVALARCVKSPGAAILTVSVVSLIAHWINWGFGLIVSALFAKEVARLVRVDYRLLDRQCLLGFRDLAWRTLRLDSAFDRHARSSIRGADGHRRDWSDDFCILQSRDRRDAAGRRAVGQSPDAAERSRQLLHRSFAAPRSCARRRQDRATRGSARDEPKRLLCSLVYAAWSGW